MSDEGVSPEQMAADIEARRKEVERRSEEAEFKRDASIGKAQRERRERLKAQEEGESAAAPLLPRRAYELDKARVEAEQACAKACAAAWLGYYERRVADFLDVWADEGRAG